MLQYQSSFLFCEGSSVFTAVSVTLKWKLHFEFVTSKKPLEKMPLPPTASDSSTWQGPSHLDVETMVWDMPIKVFATNPMYASSVSLLKTDVTGTL